MLGNSSVVTNINASPGVPDVTRSPSIIGVLVPIHLAVLT
jgi:hypothetical protein